MTEQQRIQYFIDLVTTYKPEALDQAKAGANAAGAANANLDQAARKAALGMQFAAGIARGNADGMRSAAGAAIALTAGMGKLAAAGIAINILLTLVGVLISLKDRFKGAGQSADETAKSIEKLNQTKLDLLTAQAANLREQFEGAQKAADALYNTQRGIAKSETDAERASLEAMPAGPARDQALAELDYREKTGGLEAERAKRSADIERARQESAAKEDQSQRLVENLSNAKRRMQDYVKAGIITEDQLKSGNLEGGGASAAARIKTLGSELRSARVAESNMAEAGQVDPELTSSIETMQRQLDEVRRLQPSFSDDRAAYESARKGATDVLPTYQADAAAARARVGKDTGRITEINNELKSAKQRLENTLTAIHTAEVNKAQGDQSVTDEQARQAELTRIETQLGAERDPRAIRSLYARQTELQRAGLDPSLSEDARDAKAEAIAQAAEQAMNKRLGGIEAGILSERLPSTRAAAEAAKARAEGWTPDMDRRRPGTDARLDREAGAAAGALQALEARIAKAREGNRQAFDRVLGLIEGMASDMKSRDARLSALESRERATPGLE